MPPTLRRYRANYEVLRAGMEAMGFHMYVAPESAGCIISTFLWPDDAAFRFPDFYDRLARRGFVIYPGKLTADNCFRIGSIGRLSPNDMRALLAAIREVLTEQGVSLPVRQIPPSPV